MAGHPHPIINPITVPLAALTMGVRAQPSLNFTLHSSHFKLLAHIVR